MSRLTLSAWQRQRLRRQLCEATDVRLYRRTLAVLEFAGGRPAAEIARMLGVTRQSVYHWADAYAEAHNPAVLADADRAGRPRLLDEEKDLLEALLAASPQDLGLPHTGWTTPLLREALEQYADEEVSARTIRRALQRLGYVWKRPRYVLEPDPEREKKTPDQAANPGAAPPQCRAGTGRNRPAALPALAGRLVASGGKGAGPVERPQRSPGHLRGDEHEDRSAGLRAAREGAQRGLPGVPGRGARFVLGLARGPALGRGFQPHGEGLAPGG